MSNEKKLNWADLTISFAEKIAENKQLKADIDRLHRERDSFQEQARTLAEEVVRLEQDSKRLNFLIKQGAALNCDFDGNYFVCVTNRKNHQSTFEDFDAMTCIDKAMEYEK